MFKVYGSVRELNHYLILNKSYREHLLVSTISSILKYSIDTSSIYQQIDLYISPNVT